MKPRAPSRRLLPPEWQWLHVLSMVLNTERWWKLRHWREELEKFGLSVTTKRGKT